MTIQLRLFTINDIDMIVKSFAAVQWPKPRATFEQYLQEQVSGTRQFWLAFDQDQFAGYVTLNWQSQYQPFREKNIPEIMDLNVLPNFRERGIGSTLLEAAENEAFVKSNVVGIGVGLYPGYGNAQKIYVKRGYIPDGLGVTYNYERVEPGNSVMLEDDLVLWFTREITDLNQK
jgi:GNAT superfamily N-acetyltransferase